MNSILEELESVPHLRYSALAIVDFVSDLLPGRFVRTKSGLWVYNPANFVAIKVQPKKKNLVISFYGNRLLTKVSCELPFSKGAGSTWVICKFSRPNQLPFVAGYIQSAYENHRSSARQQHKYTQ